MLFASGNSATSISKRWSKTSSDWILGGLESGSAVSRPGHGTSDMAVEAAREALVSAASRTELEAIIVCTVTPEHALSSDGVLVQTGSAQKGLGLRPSGRLFRFRIRAHHRRSPGSQRRAQEMLVIGADTMSSIIDYTDRATCILFGMAPADADRGARRGGKKKGGGGGPPRGKFFFGPGPLPPKFPEFFPKGN